MAAYRDNITVERITVIEIVVLILPCSRVHNLAQLRDSGAGCGTVTVLTFTSSHDGLGSTSRDVHLGQLADQRLDKKIIIYR